MIQVTTICYFFVIIYQTMAGFLIFLLYRNCFKITSPPWLSNTGLVSSRASLTSWGEDASLALVGHPFSNGVMIKMSYGVDVFIDRLRTPSFPIGLVKTESGFTVKSVETGLGRWTLLVVVISVDAYPFLAFSDLTCHLEDTRIGVFWLHCAAW